MLSIPQKHNIPPGYTAQNKVRLVRGGKEYFDLLMQMIEGARDTIHLQTYIYDDDKTGTLVGEALKAAAQRKVNVYLLADGYASQVMSKKFIHDLRAAGVNFRFFEPLFRSKHFYFGRRLHHKVVVVDTRYALVGGLNISDRYNDLPGQPAWLDFALYTEGEVARELCVLCWKTWKGFPPRMDITPCEMQEIRYDIQPEEACLVRMRRNDWVRRKNQISRSYLEMLKKAQSHIIILCSYFLPGNVIMRNLLLATRRGVKIKVILASISDVMLAKHAERYIYNRLLQHGIEIYEYKQNVLHGKVSVCDSTWLTIGSYNVNNISAYASIELNLDVLNPVFAAQVEETLENIIRDKCVKVTIEKYARSTNIFTQFIRWGSYQLIKLLFYLFTFYFRQRS